MYHESPVTYTWTHTVSISNMYRSPTCFVHMRDQFSPCSSWSPDDSGWYFSTSVWKDLFIVVAISFNQKIRAVASYFFSTANIHQLNPLVWKYQSPLFSWGFVWITLSTATKSCCFSLAWETMLSSRKYKQYIVRSWVKASQGEWEILMRPSS